MLMGAAYPTKDRASPRGDTTSVCSGTWRNNVVASASAMSPEAAVPTIAATSGEDSLKPTASASRNASVIVIGSARPRVEGSDCMVEAKATDLADDVRSRPGNGEYAECRRP